MIQLIDGSDEKTQSLRELGSQHVSSQNMPQVGSLILMLSLRGTQETAEPTVFSPVIEMLELAVNSNAPQNKQAIAELDRKLTRLWEQEDDAIDVRIAATVFAFLRYDLDAAGKRIKKLLAERAEKPSESIQSDLGFWLVARYALTDDRTKIAGRQLAELAIAAAEKETDPRWKQAMLRELTTD